MSFLILFLHIRNTHDFILLVQPDTVNSEIFRGNFIFANSVQTHIFDVKKSRQGLDLPKSVNERVISPIRAGLIFTNIRICEVSRKLINREHFRIYSLLFLATIVIIFLSVNSIAYTV